MSSCAVVSQESASVMRLCVSERVETELSKSSQRSVMVVSILQKEKKKVPIYTYNKFKHLHYCIMNNSYFFHKNLKSFFYREKSAK